MLFSMVCRLGVRAESVLLVQILKPQNGEGVKEVVLVPGLLSV